MSKPELKVRFINGLKDYGLSYEDIVKSGWNYCGGNWTFHQNYYKLRFPNEPLLPYADECVCGHDILHNGYICNKEETDFLVLGSCCITKFMPNGSARTCENCGIKHKRRIMNCCFGCEKFRKTINDKIIYDSMKCVGAECKELLPKHNWKKLCYSCYIFKRDYK
tara:strand:- start:1126 stop:1620 length:495 start_codon:yes stop_codon:yes gene_type:complete